MSPPVSEELHVAVGSKNPTKVNAAKRVLQHYFPDKNIHVHMLSVPSGVADQPMSDEETILGAKNRAKAAMEMSEADCTYAIGIEGGVCEMGGDYFQTGWAAVVDKKGDIGVGSGGRFQISNKIIAQLKSGREMGPVMDELSGIDDVRSTLGVIGIYTKGALDRSDSNTEALYLAFAKFVSDPVYWD
ncbi:Maf/Ham1 [Basidiobolus meristosporus CBS 931.73]|uniref:inosine/xanthosine triphosphatase n=1 Tax=Basidiobolus meristosporus CBS 931.73 TaxID=1314790 RepID=A0A1Y1XB61_9FUNG|nr:Maf/Ham1 [Basidiobolus meristosporus CBS 931.73]|eukprot:ORX82957.1 Maf/Ham1 [Basidiobolus meristosporus CBS 931.73]